MLALAPSAGRPLPAQDALVFRPFGEVSPAAGWSFAAGDVTGDGQSEIVGYFAEEGELWVGAPEESRFSFRAGRWATVRPPTGWVFTTGDMTGDALVDVVGYYAPQGELWVGATVGSSFDFGAGPWFTLSPRTGWSFVTGDFTGDGLNDVLGYLPSLGQIWVGRNTGTTFDFSPGPWATVAPAAGWAFVAGNFEPGGGLDIAGYLAADGSLWVGDNDGSSFAFSERGSVSPDAGWQFLPGDLVAGGGTELLGYYAGNGSLWMGFQLDSRFRFSRWGTLDPETAWELVVGDFSGDSRAEVAAYWPADGTLWLGEKLGPAATTLIEGYCWPLSAAPGETIEFKVSGKGSSIVEFLRHKADSSGVTSIRMGGARFTPEAQPVPPEAARDGCGWRTSFTLRVPDGWPSGIYSARLLGPDDGESHITFIVKPAPGHRSDLAVLANVNTWLAYNPFGGGSKYSGRARVSFLRPSPYTAPVFADSHTLHLTRGELWILGWLEDQGFEPHVYTDIDFHRGVLTAREYRCLVVGTHPEYWSVTMYRNLQGLLQRGGSLLYLGGNGIYEAGEYLEDMTGMVFRAGVEDGPRVEALFRRLDPPLPERALLGVATEQCGATGAPYEVQAADHPFLAGTGLVNGETMGTSGLNTGFGNGQACAWEVDTSRGPGATGLPIDCGSEAGEWPIPPGPGLPKGLTVLATGQNWFEDGRFRGAEMVTYKHPGGGIVFSVGSITFGGSLVVDAALQTILANVLAAAGCGSGAPRFRRGDCNQDARLDISDAVCILNWLFGGAGTPACVLTTNANGDPGSDISDAVYLLGFLFLGGPAPAPPFPDCGPGELPGDDPRSCASAPGCP